MQNHQHFYPPDKNAPTTRVVTLSVGELGTISKNNLQALPWDQGLYVGLTFVLFILS